MSTPLNAKFLRAFPISPAPQHGVNGCMLWIMRLVYEFWGFCVNGSNDQLNPGGVSTSHTTGSYISMPAGFETGSTVLMARGGDGRTDAGLPYFTATGSTPFSASCEGKWLTMWKSGSTSTDDSIYLITKWINSSSLLLDPTYGGTSMTSTGSVPQLTSRTDINYRVINYHSAANLTGFVSGNYMVFQFDRASDVNVGQRKSQFKIGLSTGVGTISRLRIGLSPSGSWDGTQFVTQSYADIESDIDNTGPGSGGHSTPDWFHNSTGGEGSVNLIGGVGFLICQAGGPFMSDGSNFCVEIPERLYPRENDPNPICAINVGNRAVVTTGQVGWGDASRVMPSPYDSLQRRWPCITRSVIGSYFHSTIFSGGSMTALNSARWALYHNQILNNVIIPDVTLAQTTIAGQTAPTGQFSLSRVRLRSVRFVGGFARFVRLDDGNNGRWVHVNAGMLWPWDHALIPRTLFVGT